VEAVAGRGVSGPDPGEDQGTRGSRTSSGRGAFVFIGFMGAGKSGAARAVAAALGVDAVDTDRELERELGESIESFIDREGETAFRHREEELVTRLLGQPDLEVAALGGGALQSDAIREALRQHTAVYIDVDPDEAWRRASGRGRPLARDRARFDDLYRDRRATYESVASVFLPPNGRDLVHRAVPALDRLRDGAPIGTRLVWARAESGDYPVYVAPGLVRTGFFHPEDGRRFLVTDAGVARAQGHCVDVLATPGLRAEIPQGEGEKTLARAEQLLRSMASAGVGRDDLLVALGGGVVGDLGGFCAATYQRGIRCVQVPSTLVAQVDSAYGGKTGVDLPEGKNYVGAYHQPASVLVDPELLDTLPPEERSAGYAEVVKTALIAGGDLWRRLRRGDQPDEEVVLGCLRTKLSVVAEDERDAGRRQVLNLGHTVAHAIEAATGYRVLRHGEAVALGLLCALGLSGRESLRKEVADLLAAHGLPTTVEGVDTDQVVALIGRDKKRRGGAVPFVLVDAPGVVTPGHELPDADVRAGVAEVMR
jgi:shikimate kinase / 3-dehydroquinate synthase